MAGAMFVMRPPAIAISTVAPSLSARRALRKTRSKAIIGLLRTLGDRQFTSAAPFRNPAVRFRACMARAIAMGYGSGSIAEGAAHAQQVRASRRAGFVIRRRWRRRAKLSDQNGSHHRAVSAGRCGGPALAHA